MPPTLPHTALQSVALPQGQLQYREYGQGPPVVFIHGLLVNGTLWRHVIPPLVPHARCIVLELPLGAHAVPMHREADLSPPSLARLISDFLAALDLWNVTLVANDTGGAFTQILLAQPAERVSAAVLTNCEAFENFLPLRFRYLTWGAWVPGFFWLMGRSMQVPALRRLPFAYGHLTREAQADELLAHYARPMQRHAGVRRDLAKVLRGVSSRHTVDAARHLTAARPALVVWGTDDPIFPLAHARRLSQLLGAQLIEVPNACAFVPVDQPLQLAAAIQTLLERLGPTGGHPVGVGHAIQTGVKSEAQSAG